MGKTYSFEINRTSSASPASLFALEADGSRWSEWAKPVVFHSRWAREPDADGVGAVRAVGLWPVYLHEETLEYEQDRKHVYGFAGLAPLKDYRAEVSFTPNASGGTDLRWTGRFTEPLPGTGVAVRTALRTVISILATRLVKHAERA
ncbi:MxaD family protein [Amycolatopsis sp. WAC 01375]|uniref:SRPBCC family protein n=1 Tax=Amycolatopsis sp. WAC 01375 TaxID=2203194 RepID=UPI000F7B6BF8|nr:SRPBCC family protein [Amycolatopsis sp. WAC 01375]RSM83443.1 MxaD family protein [Amycolatopsis sp. WAC 01375]